MAIQGVGGEPHVKRSDIVYRNMRDSDLLRRYYSTKTFRVGNSMDVAGDSPTDIFIGRYGYPKVFIGPLVPPVFGNTEILATPEMWRNISSIPKIFEMRTSLVRGLYETNVKNVEKGKVEEVVRDLALAERPAGAQLSLKVKSNRPSLDDESTPFGPSGSIRELEVGNMRAEKKVERLYSDTDARAVDAVFELYESGIPVSKIQRGFSAGLFGRGPNRKFVPTRWSITAVDDTISKENLKEVKGYDSIDSIMAFYNVALDNRWLIFFFPGSWEYESLEAFWPGTVWNENGKDISIFGSYEPYEGRKTYAEMGGCYYSGRLAVTEKMRLLGRQGSALILREAHEGYTAPVGVWNVREHVRGTLETEPVYLDGINDVFSFIGERLTLTKSDWVKNSRMLRLLLSQKKLADYIKNKETGS
jgi:hypothetical protein